MLKFIFGAIIGGFIGVLMMCLCAVSGRCSRQEEINSDRRIWTDEEDTR